MRLKELTQVRQALGGEVNLTIVTDQTQSDAEIIFKDLWVKIYSFERSFSRFLPMSELSVLNRQAGIKTFITPEFKELLICAKNLSIRTNGLYNPFILPALQRAGYLQSAAIGYEKDKQENYSNHQVVAINKLKMGDNWATIPYGTALDLGGCGKGYLAGKLAESLDKLPIKGYWLNLGGDIATYGLDENGQRIAVNIQNANNLGPVSDWIIECPLELSAVATSGTFRRQNQSNGKRWHHIIDPTTLKPAQTDVRLATVVANTAVDADVLASCAIILGSKKAPAFLKKLGVTSALLQCFDSNGNYFVKNFGTQIKKIIPEKTAKALQYA